MRAAAEPAKATVSPHRCGRHPEQMLVDVVSGDVSGGVPARITNDMLTRKCPRCVPGLVVVDVVRGLHAVVGSKVAGGKV